MPELPEVQTVVTDLQQSKIIGGKFLKTEIFCQKIIANLTAEKFSKIIKNKTIIAVKRRAKFIIFELSEYYFLIIHLRMTGRFNLLSTDVPRSKHEHIIFTFENKQELRFHDTRKFGWMFLTQNFQEILGHLGVEPLEKDFTLAYFKKCLGKSKRQIKPFLLDQSIIVGLGNIYTDEALWEAKIHPQRLSNSLTISEIKALYQAIPQVLKQGIENGGTTVGGGEGNFYSLGKRRGENVYNLKAYHQTGMNCQHQNCYGVIKRIVVAQRGTHFCPLCQKLSSRH